MEFGSFLEKIILSDICGNTLPERRTCSEECILVASYYLLHRMAYWSLAIRQDALAGHALLHFFHMCVQMNRILGQSLRLAILDILVNVRIRRLLYAPSL